MSHFASDVIQLYSKKSCLPTGKTEIIAYTIDLQLEKLTDSSVEILSEPCMWKDN